jgi:ATP-dependent RNA helicase RhlE
MSFSSLGLADNLVQAVNDRGYTEPTPIQRQAIPAVLAGGDLLAGAQTGTGKTAAFTLPILQLLTTRPAPEGRTRQSIRALILTPTRELAAQVQESVRDYGSQSKLKSMAMFGGVSINPQIKQLTDCDILVATPGRLLDHVQQRTVDLSRVEILVLDEADRMLDMGFIHDIKRILKLLPAKRQNLLFSATFSDEIKALAEGLLDNPALIEVARRNAAADLIEQSVYLVDRERKRELLTKLIQDNNWFQVLVFTRTKHGANRLAEQLEKSGISAMAIHGNKSQGARTKALAEFKAAKLQVLVATDIAARGIDINELPHVVNVAEDYVHRIGRTGRAGSEGEALSLVCIDEFKLLSGIERVLKRELERKVLPGFEPDPSIKAEPIPNGRQPRTQGGQRQGQGQPRSDRPRSDRPKSGRPRNDRPRNDRPRQDNNPHSSDGQRPSQPRPPAQPRINGDEQQPLSNENRNPFEGIKPARRYHSGSGSNSSGSRSGTGGQPRSGQPARHGQPARPHSPSSPSHSPSRPTPRTHNNPSGAPPRGGRGGDRDNIGNR